VSELFLPDTDVISNLRKAKPHPRPVSWLQSAASASVFLPAATVAEVQYRSAHERCNQRWDSQADLRTAGRSVRICGSGRAAGGETILGAAAS
jgi:predicted nucleic acid-binding protein